MRHFGLVLPSHPGFCGSTALQVWKSEEGDLLDTWVRSKEEVSSRLLAHLGIRASSCVLFVLLFCLLRLRRSDHSACSAGARPPTLPSLHAPVAVACLHSQNADLAVQERLVLLGTRT